MCILGKCKKNGHKPNSSIYDLPPSCSCRGTAARKRGTKMRWASCAAPSNRRGKRRRSPRRIAGNFSPKLGGPRVHSQRTTRTSHQQRWACGDALREWQKLIVSEYVL